MKSASHRLWRRSTSTWKGPSALHDLYGVADQIAARDEICIVGGIANYRDIFLRSGFVESGGEPAVAFEIADGRERFCG